MKADPRATVTALLGAAGISPTEQEVEAMIHSNPTLSVISDIPATIAEAADALRGGRLTSVALTEQLLARSDALDAKLGTFIARFDAPALAAAKQADADFAAGIDRGPLQGIPLGIKDIIAAREGATTACSKVLDPDWGRGVDAPVVART
jgi:aspartyl-tRNA(Asn)/glutamyl-tRNA(Gln) amidotransferase subunit A